MRDELSGRIASIGPFHLHSPYLQQIYLPCYDDLELFKLSKNEVVHLLRRTSYYCYEFEVGHFIIEIKTAAGPSNGIRTQAKL